MYVKWITLDYRQHLSFTPSIRDVKSASALLHIADAARMGSRMQVYFRLVKSFVSFNFRFFVIN